MENIVKRTLDEAFVTTTGLHTDQVSQMYDLYQDIKSLEAKDALNSALKHEIITAEEGGAIYNQEDKRERMVMLVEVVAKNLPKVVTILRQEGRNISANRLQSFMEWPEENFNLGLEQMIVLLRSG